MAQTSFQTKYTIEDRLKQRKIIFLFFFSLALQSQFGPLAYLHETPFYSGLLDLRHSIGLFGLVISSSQGLLPVHKHRKTHIHQTSMH
jgi:hypothetical protein